MEIAVRALGWVLLTWFIGGLLVGGAMIVRDERRLRREKPKPEDVKAYADVLIAQHGSDAFHVNGKAMYDARIAKDFKRHRFLKEVSGELINRLFSCHERHETVDTSP